MIPKNICDVKTMLYHYYLIVSGTPEEMHTYACGVQGTQSVKLFLGHAIQLWSFMLTSEYTCVAPTFESSVV